ncbi:MAG: Flp pilus assembly protein CpaB [Chloroflexota bacterium]|nr:Flp pilus assembly protein CpaB [Chloroflexota bacterium]
MPRRILFAIALVAGCLAAALYYGATRRTDVVVMSRDMTELRALTHEDVEVRTISAELVPEDAIRTVDEALGSVPRALLARGQLVLGHAIAAEAADFRSGQSLEEGTRAIAIPVTAVNAVGGAVIPGARVDVLSVPVAGRAPAGRPAEVLLTGALVLDVRGESGAPYSQREPRSTAGLTDRIASVVIAISFIDEARFADRLASSTFVLALVGAR